MSGKLEEFFCQMQARETEQKALVYVPDYEQVGGGDAGNDND